MVYHVTLIVTEGNDEINVHACDEWAFNNACMKGHFEIAKWLCTISGIRINLKYVLSYVILDELDRYGFQSIR